ncbi:TOBE domain-containing protein [Natronobacterium texcoconense]|uniref:TOBE domain-containing protein n=1 Tax=Natronobacterium texcoconense TaxID=1095778 RepID=UPI0026884FBB
MANSVGIGYNADTEFGRELENGEPWYELALETEEGDGAHENISLADSSADVSVGDVVTCHVRPSDLAVDPSNPKDSSLTGEVARVADLGRRYDVTVRLESGQELLVERATNPPAADDVVGIDFPAEKLTLFETDHRKRVDVGPAY